MKLGRRCPGDTRPLAPRAACRRNYQMKAVRLIALIVFASYNGNDIRYGKSPAAEYDNE